MFLRAIFLVLITKVLLLATLSEQDIKPQMQEKTQLAIKILKDKTLNADTKVDKVFEIFDPIFDYALMARLSLGDGFNTLNDDQKQQFSKSFEQNLKKSYSDKILIYNDQNFVIEDAKKPNPNRYWLNSKIVNNNQEYEIVYKFYNANERGWLIYDIDVLGISLIKTYRSQFQDILQNGNFKQLMNKLKQANITQ